MKDYNLNRSLLWWTPIILRLFINCIFFKTIKS